MPAGFTPGGLPVGVELLARPFEDGRLISLGYAWEQRAKPRRAPPRTPSLVSDTLDWSFEIDADSMKGELRLDRPTQVLHYKLDAPGLDADGIADIRLHRSVNGPVIALLGSGLEGSVAIHNSELDQLADGKLAVVIYTGSAPQGLIRGRIKRR